MRIQEIPFTILALTPLSPVSDSHDRQPVHGVDLFSLNAVMEEITPGIFIPVPRELCPEGGLTIRFKGIQDFKPDRVIENNPYLKDLYDARSFIQHAISDGAAPSNIAERLKTDWPLLPFAFHASVPEKTPEKETSAVDDILSMVAIPGGTDRPIVSTGAPRQWKAQLDETLSSLLEHVFDNKAFRSCEAAWRGIELLLKQGPVKEGDGIRLNITPVTSESLEGALDNLTTDLLDDLPNLILIDVPFDNSPKHIALLKKVATFADTMLVPTVFWINPRFFHLENWSELGRVPYIGHFLDDAAYAKWRKVKELPGADWMNCCCNRFLTRFPYGQNNHPGTVVFQEKEPLWISPIWALGTLAAGSIATFGWPTRFTDYTSIALKDLALFNDGSGMPTPTEMTLSEDRLVEFIEAGITPLMGVEGRDTAFMPKETTVAGGSLKYQLFISRVLTFLLWCRDHMKEEFAKGDVSSNLKEAFKLFWQQTGHVPPDDLEITAEPASKGDPTLLKIAMTPPGAILPGGRRLEMTFQW